MPLTLANNDKFALVAILNAYSSLPVNAEHELADGTWVLDRVPLGFEDPWREWVGSIRFDALKRANVVLLRKLPSTNPEIVDSQHEELARPIEWMFYLLQLAGVLEYEGAHLLKGSIVSDIPQVRQMSEFRKFRQTKGYSRLPLDLLRLEHVLQLKKGLDETDAPQCTAKRIIRGLNVLMDGLQQSHGQERIHQFVRSLEALILPETGQTKRQFVHRCQTFAKPGPDAMQVLEQAFDMRSDTEHLNDWDRSLQAYAAREREHVALHRTRQMERLASIAYMRILENASIRSRFGSETAQLEFWKALDDAARRTVWGTPFDLASVDLAEEYDSWGRAVSP